MEDMRRDTRPLSSVEYLRQAMAHRFCVVAPGDNVASRKIAESIAVGGSGGCIPLIVVPESGGVDAIRRQLPYTRWLDYCSIAFLTTEHAITSRDRLPAILRLKPYGALNGIA